MKIHLDGVSLSSRSGPNTFASRLAHALIINGHELVLDGPTADVSLVFIEPTGAPLAKKVVQRLDGIWFKPSEFATKNVEIKKLYDSADAVIWQSNFDKGMTTHWWGRPKSGEVIRNGIDLTPVSNVTIPQLQQIRNSYEHVFVCSSNWHPQKRLKANVQLFEHLRNKGYSNSCLFILGSNPDVRAQSPHIFYTGSQPPEVYLQIFAVSNWMFHLAWADHCPNVVIESLSQGTPVVCSSVGGTKELVGEFGLVLNEQDYNYELTDYDNPPPIDVTQLDQLPKKHALGTHTDIDIRHVAQHYIEALKRVVQP